MRIGIVSPYSFDTPGGVQNHVHDLAETLIGLGHYVNVLAPAADDEELPRYVTPAGRSVPVPYNGSVARVSFGPISATRVRRWLTTGRFDVLHVHEPIIPSLSMLAVLSARGPVVATFHTAITRSRTMAAAQGLLQIVLEKITARIAVSALARRVQVEHLGGDAWEIPNGVVVARFADAEPFDGWPGGPAEDGGGAIGFLGRFTEERKGFPVLADAFVALAAERPRLAPAGGRAGGARRVCSRCCRSPCTTASPSSARCPRPTRRACWRSLDIYVAPNTRGESFGMILTEALAAGTPIVASDLDAFRRVLDGGRAGLLFPTGDTEALTKSLRELLDDPAQRAAYTAEAARVVAAYDWTAVAQRVLEVYALAIEATTGESVHVDAATPV